MAKITLNNDQLRLIQTALDFYSRIGILQFERLIEHPTIDNLIMNKFSPKKKLEVGDNTMRGVIVEIGKGYIKTKGSWGNGEEIRKWTDVDNIKHSPDWGEVHYMHDKIKEDLNKLKNLISDENLGNGNYGIGNKNVDNSCRDAFDLIQVIRHEFWKENPNKSNMTVDSSVHIDEKNNNVKVDLDTIKDVRKRKLNKIKN